jgi:hypothetical protein
MALFTTLAEDKARLIPGRTVNPTIAGDKLLRRWEYIDATVADTLVTTLKSTSTVTNPQADGQTYTGKFAVGEVLAQAQGDRSVTVTQELTLVNEITSTIGTLQALSPLKEYDNEILRAFSLEEGEGDRILWRYLNIDPTDRSIAMAYSDSDLETTLGASSGTYLARSFDIQDDGTATFTIITEEHTWTTWTAHKAAGPDLIIRSDVGTDTTDNQEGEVLSLRKIYYGVRIADVQTAVDECADGTVAPDAGYVVMQCIGNDNQDGSATITQILVKSINGRSESGSIQLNPHALQSGVTTNVVTVYRNFVRDQLPAGSSVTEGGNVISNIPKIQGDGLWSREVVTRVPTWTAKWDENNIEMQQANVSGYKLTENNQVTGVANSDLTESYTEAQTASDANTRVVTMVELIERANGERVINQTEKYASIVTTDAGATVIRIGANVGNRDAALGRIWWRRTSAAKETLITGGAATSDYSYLGVDYTHTDVKVTDNGDGTFDVYQLLTVPTSSTSAWGGKFDTQDEVEWSHDEVELYDAGGAGLKSYHRTVYRKVFTSYGENYNVEPTSPSSGAIGYAEFGTGSNKGVGPSTPYQTKNGKVTHGGYVKYQGSDGTNDYWAGFNVHLKEDT